MILHSASRSLHPQQSFVIQDSALVATNKPLEPPDRLGNVCIVSWPRYQWWGVGSQPGVQISVLDEVLLGVSLVTRVEGGEKERETDKY